MLIMSIEHFHASSLHWYCIVLETHFVAVSVLCRDGCMAAKLYPKQLYTTKKGNPPKGALHDTYRGRDRAATLMNAQWAFILPLESRRSDPVQSRTLDVCYGTLDVCVRGQGALTTQINMYLWIGPKRYTTSRCYILHIGSTVVVVGSYEYNSD